MPITAQLLCLVSLRSTSCILGRQGALDGLSLEDALGFDLALFCIVLRASSKILPVWRRFQRVS